MRAALASIGRDSEDALGADVPKPRLWLQPQTTFATARDALPRSPACRILKLSQLRTAAGALLYARTELPGFYDLVGPPTAAGLREVIAELGGCSDLVVVDGAVDRIAAVAGSDGAIVVACGAAGAQTQDEAVDEVAGLAARLAIPRFDDGAPALEIEGALTAAQAARFLAAGESRQIVVRDPTQVALSGKAAREALARLRIRCRAAAARYRGNRRFDRTRAKLRAAELPQRRCCSDGAAGLRRLPRKCRGMKAFELLDGAAAHVLEFEWLRAAVAPVSPYGDRIFEDLRPFAAGEERTAQARAQRVAAVSQRAGAERIDAVRGVLRDVPDATPAIARAAIGGVLGDPSLLELRRFGAAIARIDALLADDPPLANAAVLKLREMLDAGQDRENEFYLSDAFDESLGAARRELMQAQAELDAARGRESERAARELGRTELGEEFIVMRAEHSGPLPQGVRVMREAPTYFLCTLEYGDAALAALRRRDDAAAAIAAAEESVRDRISDLVRSEARGLEAAAAALGELDVLFAAAHFAHRFGCLPATIVDRPALAFEGARFLPLEAALATAGRPFVPLEIELHDAAVLTGPNMGGKSVALRTCGFVAVCAAFGLPVPAARARLGLFDRIAWLGIGREEPMGGLLVVFCPRGARAQRTPDQRCG